MIDHRQSDSREPWEHEPWVRELDALVRPSLVVDPPAEVQRSILAAVLVTATSQPLPMPVPAPISRAGAEGTGRPVPLAAYVLLAAVLVAYIAGLSWLQGMFGSVTWIAILAQQLVTVAEQIVGRPTSTEPLALIWQLFARAPWLALLPVAWLLWDRDRASAPTA
jgi:hypothetical protein